MAIFSSSVAVDMTQLLEIALLVDGELQMDFGTQNFAIGHIGEISYLLSGVFSDGGVITGVSVIKGGEIVYGFRDVLIIPEVQPLNTLDAVLATLLSGDDRITGSGGHDVLIGLKGSDEIDGRGGNDVIIGGDGADTLLGRSGSDTFVLDVMPATSRRADTLSDFKPGKDKVGLDALVFSEVGNKVTGKEFETGAEAERKAARLIYDDERGALFYDSDGTGKAAPIKIALLDAGLDLRASDFIVL